MMIKEQKRLLTMLKENKISEDDYQIISAALNKKSVFSNIENSILINPFQKIAGLQALGLGLILMVAMSLTGIATDAYFDGIIGYMIPLGLKTAVKPNFFLLLYQNAAAVFITASMFITVSLLFRQKRIRIIDFFGTVALARFPLFISILFTMLEKHLSPSHFKEDISKGIELHLTLLGTVGNLIFLTCLIWQIATYFFALKEASGLEGKSLWRGFLIAILLGDVAGIILTRLFLYV
ncbi:hypothetical protein [Legionella shakespearei]|uniref:Yip1 domain protein n=1 Tax=Legionella shakespearei DSM 23087 TaxID=1122169 RepID=A0A0W0YQS1_9GAMM|nr:hypothetical protein [Legionella shakespearei]KTD58899.1 hypothetical protein Lsha_2117 [Legionella shakespearei DSM 23087]